MPRTLVTGATGFLGSHVTRLLVERGDEVWATVRPRSNVRALDELGVTTVRADVRDRRAVRYAMRDVDRVFHLAGTTNLRLSRERVFALNADRARRGATGLRRAGRVHVLGRGDRAVGQGPGRD